MDGIIKGTKKDHERLRAHLAQKAKKRKEYHKDRLKRQSLMIFFIRGKKIELEHTNNKTSLIY